MIKTLSAALALTFVAGAAFACPDYAQSGQTYEFSPKSIGGGVSMNIVAGGDNYVPDCGLNVEAYVTSAPDFTFYMSGVSGRNVVLSVTSQCDAALVINNADAQWYYDDDSNGNADPRAVIPGMDGAVDIWVGTYNGEYCDATLYVALQ